MKIILIKDKEKIEELSDMLSGKTIGTATWCTSNPMYLEFFNGETSKGNALRKVAEMCGLTLDEIIAIGDGENDIPMLEIVGRSVAMGNAEQCIKDIADEATLTCDEDGVAAVIEKYFI